MPVRRVYAHVANETNGACAGREIALFSIGVVPMTEESKVDMVGLGLDCRRDDTDLHL
jgi:hypothetical protein